MASLFRFLFNIYSVYTARLRYFRFHVRHLDFRQNDTVDFVGDGTIEKPTPENIGIISDGQKLTENQLTFS